MWLINSKPLDVPCPLEVQNKMFTTITEDCSRNQKFDIKKWTDLHCAAGSRNDIVQVAAVCLLFTQ